MIAVVSRIENEEKALVIPIADHSHERHLAHLPGRHPDVQFS
jgi:hypothetical protein